MAMTMSFYEFAQAHRDVIKKWVRVTVIVTHMAMGAAHPSW
jgi:hypothetical protein